MINQVLSNEPESGKYNKEKKRKIEIIKRRIAGGLAGVLTIIAIAGATEMTAERQKERAYCDITENGILKGDEKYYPVKDISSIKYLQKEMQVTYGEESGQDLKIMKIPKNGIEMRVSQDLLSLHKEDFEWCRDYLNNIFEFINPDVKFNLVEITESEDNTFDSIHYSKYESDKKLFAFTYLWSIRETKLVGRNWLVVNDKAPEVLKSDVKFNFYGDYGDLFKNNEYSFKYTLLHETLHALGLSKHIEIEEYGGMMTSHVRNVPLCLSPKEFALLISFYGADDRIDEYNDFLSWYTDKYYKACDNMLYLNYVYKSRKLTKHQVQSIEKSIVDVSAYENER